MKKVLLALICSGAIITAAASIPAVSTTVEKSAHCQCKNCTCNPCNCTPQKNSCCDAKGDCSSDCGKVAVVNEAVTKAQAQQG